MSILLVFLKSSPYLLYIYYCFVSFQQGTSAPCFAIANAIMTTSALPMLQDMLAIHVWYFLHLANLPQEQTVRIERLMPKTTLVFFIRSTKRSNTKHNRLLIDPVSYTKFSLPHSPDSKLLWSRLFLGWNFQLRSTLWRHTAFAAEMNRRNEPHN